MYRTYDRYTVIVADVQYIVISYSIGSSMMCHLVLQAIFEPSEISGGAGLPNHLRKPLSVRLFGP